MLKRIVFYIASLFVSESRSSDASHPPSPDAGTPDSAPVRDSSATGSAAPRRTPEEESVLTTRYCDALREIFDHAIENRSVPVLIDVLAWSVAALLSHYGGRASGDFFARLGMNLSHLTEQQEARHSSPEERNGATVH